MKSFVSEWKTNIWTFCFTAVWLETDSSSLLQASPSHHEFILTDLFLLINILNALSDLRAALIGRPATPEVSAADGSERGEGGDRTSDAGWAARWLPRAPTGRPMTACPAAGGPAHQGVKEVWGNLLKEETEGGDVTRQKKKWEEKKNKDGEGSRRIKDRRAKKQI